MNLAELRAKLEKIESVAELAIARCTDPKDIAEHERWRAQKTAEIRALIKAEMAAQLPTVESTALKVRCPICQALPDERCTRDENSLQQVAPHEERYNLARNHA